MRPRLLFTALLVSIGLFLSACGGSTESGATDPKPSQAATVDTMFGTVTIPTPEDGPIMEGEEVPEEAPVDAEALSLALGRARAAAVRTALIERGIARGRIVVDSAGAAEPVSENDTPRARNRNRRVELRMYVPKRSAGR